MIYEGTIRVSATEAAHLFAVPVGTVRRWAHEDNWTAHGPRKQRRWELDQVQVSYDRRRAVDERACA